MWNLSNETAAAGNIHINQLLKVNPVQLVYTMQLGDCCRNTAYLYFKRCPIGGELKLLIKELRFHQAHTLLVK